MKILEYHNERLALALPEREALDGVERPLPAPRRIECLPLWIVHRDVEECQERWEHRIQRPIEGEELAGNLLADCSLIVPVLNLEVSLEQVNDWQIWRRLTVG